MAQDSAAQTAMPANAAAQNIAAFLPRFNPAYFLDRAAWAHPMRISLWYGERSWSVSAAANTTRQLAQLLMHYGVRSGDRVAVIARNSPYHLFFHLACARIGAVFVPVSYRFTSAELERIMGVLEPAVIVADPETAAHTMTAVTGKCETHSRSSCQSRGNTCMHARRCLGYGDAAGSDRAGAAIPIQFVIDDDAEAGLPSEIAPPSELLETALTAGWLGLASELERLRGDTQEIGETAPAVGMHGSHIPYCPDEPEDSETFGYPEGLAAIVLTSGSAGEPKFVPLTHENLWWGSQNFREGFEYSTMDTELVAAPLSHIGGLNGTTVDLFSHGGCVVIVRQFHPDVVLRELERHRVAIMFAVPTMYSMLLDSPAFSRTDLSCFRLPLTGGSSPSPDLLIRLDKAGLRALNVWGMTETSASGCYLPSQLLWQKLGSIGWPFAHVQARIVDTVTGQTLACTMAGQLQSIALCGRYAVGEDEAEIGNSREKYEQEKLFEAEGELWLRGPSIVTVYWRPGDAVRKSAHDSAHETENVWLQTGDLVRLDADGCLWVLGRIDEMINTGGEKVSPAEVERVIAAYPGVADVAVTGIADRRWGETVAAAIVLRAGVKSPSISEIREFAGKRLADYKCPRAVRIVDSLPLNSNGKLDRGAVAQLFEE